MGGERRKSNKVGRREGGLDLGDRLTVREMVVGGLLTFLWCLAVDGCTFLGADRAVTGLVAFGGMAGVLTYVLYPRKTRKEETEEREEGERKR